MKTTLLNAFLVFFCLLSSAVDLRAQITYVSKTPRGLWTDPNTWNAFEANGTPVPNSFPAPNANNIVLINNDVRLNTDYRVAGDNGSLIITEQGSLSHTGQFTLTVGDQQGSPFAQQRISVAAREGVAMNLYKLEFIKALGTIGAEVRTASCLTITNNTNLTIPTTLVINGNLVIDQGNTSANGGSSGGTILVRGALDAATNATRNYARITIIAQNDPNISRNCNVLVPLPVELVSFSAKYDNKQVVVRWATASEKDAANFSVERSSDGKNFSSVALVPAAGTSATRREYEAIDRSMRSGLNYYRLKQTDLDGTFTYSQVLPVQVGEAVQQLEAYGSQGNLNIVMQTPGTLQQLRVLDPMGRVLYSETLSEGATGLVTRSVPMAAGTGSRVYMVQAVTSQGVVNKKFMTVN